MRGLGLLLAALWAAAIADPAFARGSRLDAILESHTLRVGTTGDYPPFTALDKRSGEYSGFDIDMARSVAQRSASNSSSFPRPGATSPRISPAAPSTSPWAECR
jgi:ABC-type amino acid transport substrate-binding protein